jgi:hypothetical protein
MNGRALLFAAALAVATASPASVLAEIHPHGGGAGSGAMGNFPHQSGGMSGFSSSGVTPPIEGRMPTFAGPIHASGMFDHHHHHHHGFAGGGYGIYAPDVSSWQCRAVLADPGAYPPDAVGFCRLAISRHW